MALIHEYLVGLARRLRPQNDAVLLDYGCGAGEMVQIANSAGFNAYGVDMFYGGGSAREAAARAGLLGDKVRELEDGCIPFPDHHFDVILSNQVFEHIDEFDVPLREINRILKPGGVFVNTFPTLMVWREGHIGIPFTHWFAQDSKLRWWYTLTLRKLGVSFHRQRAEPREWTNIYLDWIDQWTFYKPFSKVRILFERYFSVEDYAGDYLVFRLTNHPRLGWVSKLLNRKALNGTAQFFAIVCLVICLCYTSPDRLRDSLRR